MYFAKNAKLGKCSRKLNEPSPQVNEIMINQPFNPVRQNKHSQYGEDGVLEGIFEVLGVKSGWCVEFGAWDGKYLSNTFKLMEEGWSGVFIEGSKRRHLDLLKTYDGMANAHPVCAYVEFEGERTLDQILANTPIPKFFDLLSIDIDGNDYHIWDSLQVYVPKVVVIEFNPTIPPHVEFVQPRDMSVNQSSSLLSMVLLGRQKGYELVATTQCNAFFVQKSLYPQFNLEDNRPEKLFSSYDQLMHVFQLFDGTLVFEGNRRLLWHALPIPKTFQLIPKLFRRLPYMMSPLQYKLYRLWKGTLRRADW